MHRLFLNQWGRGYSNQYSMIPTRAEPFIVRVRAIAIITMAIFFFVVPVAFYKRFVHPSAIGVHRWLGTYRSLAILTEHVGNWHILYLR